MPTFMDSALSEWNRKCNVMVKLLKKAVNSPYPLCKGPSFAWQTLGKSRIHDQKIRKR